MTNEILYKTFCCQCKRLQNVQGDLMCLESSKIPINQFDDGYRGMHGWIGHLLQKPTEVYPDGAYYRESFVPPDDCDFKLERMVFEQREIHEEDSPSDTPQ